MKDQSAEQSATATRPPIVDENVCLLLGTYCKGLVKALSSLPVEKECIDLDIDSTIFHDAHVNGIYVMIKDIPDLLTMNWLDVSIIQVFMMFLNMFCKQHGVTSIVFACPTQISADMINLNFYCCYIISNSCHGRTQGSSIHIGTISSKCPQQPGGSECGYYVMRYMYEIVTKHSTLDCLDEVFEDGAYTINEIDDIRELWAHYFSKE